MLTKFLTFFKHFIWILEFNQKGGMKRSRSLIDREFNIGKSINDLKNFEFFI